MTLVFGGAYQGKLDFVKEEFSKTDHDVHRCGDTIDWSKDVLYGLEEYLLYLIRQGQVPTEIIAESLFALDGKIVILQDISCGIVPLEADLRLWREEVGRVMVILSKAARQVYRVYCGIPSQLKGVLKI